jgi:hypothetical protein
MRLGVPQKPTAARLAVGLAALASLLGSPGLLTAASLAAMGRAGASQSEPSGPPAHAARTWYLREAARLRLVRGNESTLSERGSAAGTFSGSLTAQLTISAEHVSAVFTFYPRGGSVTGRASAHFIVRGHTGYYGGTLKITRGTGAYRHASGTNIGISGTIDRYSFALMVKANGWIKL